MDANGDTLVKPHVPISCSAVMYFVFQGHTQGIKIKCIQNNRNWTWENEMNQNPIKIDQNIWRH